MRRDCQRRVVSMKQLPVKLIRCDSGLIQALCFSSNGRWLATSGEDGVPLLWDTGTWCVHRALRAGQPLTGPLAFSPDARMVVASGPEQIVAFDTANGSLLWSWKLP